MQFASEIVLRLLLAAFLGMVVGLERASQRKPAGIRTIMLISLGSALFTVLSEAMGRIYHGDPTRIGNTRCVQASPGRYMCSYAVTRPGKPKECHLMQARWTPNQASTVTVTLAGRTKRCGTLRQAIDSLG